MSTINPYDYPTLRPRERRIVVITAVLLGIATLALTSSVAAYVGLAYLGWHPIPNTSFGCSLHKRFHSSHETRVTSQEIDLNSDCLSVQLLGVQKVLRDPQSLTRVRRWFDERWGLWFEGPLVGLRVMDPSTTAFIELRPCPGHPSHAAEPHVAVGDDWIESSLGKGFRRPVCRGEWRQLAALLKDGK